MKHEIKRLTHGGNEITIELENGTSLSISSNPGYFHLHFSRIEGGITASLLAGNQQHQLKLANYVDIEYKGVER